MNMIIKKAIATHHLDKTEIVELLQNDAHNDDLFHAADDVRRQFVGDEIHLRGLIEFSNICKNNCLYCGLRRDNKKIQRYRMDSEEILILARHARDMGLKTIVLQSGEDVHFTTEKLCKIIKNIKELGLALTLSIGEKTFAEYRAYREAGADRYLIRIETTDRNLYAENDPGMSWERRKRCLMDLRKLNYEVGSGCLVGLPKQTLESIADDILFFKEIDADMIGVGPFIPHADTPLKTAKGGDLTLALKVMALTRLLLPLINIPATTAMETLAPNGQLRALQSGANVIMPNMTTIDYRKFYELYPGKTTTGDTPQKSLEKIYQKVESIGRKICTDCGSSKNWNRNKK